MSTGEVCFHFIVRIKMMTNIDYFRLERSLKSLVFHQ